MIKLCLLMLVCASARAASPIIEFAAQGQRIADALESARVFRFRERAIDLTAIAKKLRSARIAFVDGELQVDGRLVNVRNTPAANLIEANHGSFETLWSSFPQVTRAIVVYEAMGLANEPDPGYAASIAIAHALGPLIEKVEVVPPLREGLYETDSDTACGLRVSLTAGHVVTESAHNPRSGRLCDRPGVIEEAACRKGGVCGIDGWSSLVALSPTTFEYARGYIMSMPPSFAGDASEMIARQLAPVGRVAAMKVDPPDAEGVRRARVETRTLYRLAPARVPYRFRSRIGGDLKWWSGGDACEVARKMALDDARKKCQSAGFPNCDRVVLDQEAREGARGCETQVMVEGSPL